MSSWCWRHLNSFSEIDAIDSELQNLITLVVDAREALQNSSGCGGNATLCDNLDQALNVCCDSRIFLKIFFLRFHKADIPFI